MSKPNRNLPLKTTLAGLLVAGALVAGTALQPVNLVAKEMPPPANASVPEFNLNQGFSALVEKIKPAVVNVSTTSTAKIPGFRGDPSPHFKGPGGDEFEEFFRRFFEHQSPRGEQMPRERRSRAVGSGFIVDPDGLVVTNHHVIDDAEEIEIVFDDGKRLPAKVKGFDKKTDLALLEVKTDQPLPYVTFGDSDQAHVGDWVVAIGNPFGLGGSTTAGIISARGRDIHSGPLDDYIQIDAPINRGNSGGPLFNTRGEVIGVNTAIYSPNGGSVGIGFAIPSVMAKNVISQLKSK
ncbi:MAG: trypsin-like peptidase domain-containing protein, partial [Pseudomonadota bacterium]|nr:trypsin-like peptidase domain-containing protein [Pseudomonadota bacterium]